MLIVQVLLPPSDNFGTCSKTTFCLLFIGCFDYAHKKVSSGAA